MPARLRLVLIGLCACAVAAVVGVAAAPDGGSEERGDLAGPSGFAGSVRPPGLFAPAFSLADQDGETATLAQLRGRPAVLTFVYSTCEDTCPLIVQQIRGALDDLGTDVPVVGFSVDPDNDTPARAKRFLLEQRMTGRMRFVLGSRAELAPVWKAFGIAPQGGELDHSAYVVLVDGAGRQRLGFPYGQLTPEALAHDLRLLARE